MFLAKRDIWIGGATIALAFAGWFVIIPLGVDVPKSVKILALSPDFWPRIVMVILAVSGVVVLVQGLLEVRGRGDEQPHPENTHDPVPSENEDVVHFETKVQAIRVVGAFVGLFAFYFLSPILGVVGGCGILVFVATRILGVVSNVKSLLLAVLLPIFLYLFFSKVAHIPIPLGLLEELR